MFTSQGRIIGAGIEQYLLEKSRVCRQGHEVSWHYTVDVCSWL